MPALRDVNFAILNRRWPALAAALPEQASSPGVNDLDRVIAQACPSGVFSGALLIAGGGLGLWSAVHRLPCKVDQMPTHRPPIYILAQPSDLQDLSADHSPLLADPRVHLFVGDDAFAQWQQFQRNNPQIPAAQLSLIADAALLPRGMSIDTAWAEHLAFFNTELESLERELSHCTSRLLTQAQPRQLRILGVSSRYTTFIQHSMRDWLDGMRQLGHETELVIESFDHEIGNPISLARAALQFQPDLIVMIDHYRNELRGLPKCVPCVMWVQDELTSIFSPTAGTSQGELDFCLGFGRLHLRDKYGYPEQRFLPTPMGVNVQRFAPSEEAPDEFDCDLAFVSHASAPATTLLEKQLARSDELARKVLIEIFDWLRSIYDAQQCVRHASAITRFIDDALLRRGLRLPATQRQAFDEFFIQRINNAMFRHQALQWAAGSGLRLQLWGRGWEQHGRLRKFAMGPASNEAQLLQIYQRSAINLQIIPTGAVHQRLLDGLAAGGFFLIRGTAGDRVEPLYQKLIERCGVLGITTSEQIEHSSDGRIQQCLSAIETLLGVSPLKLSADLFDVLRLSADADFCRSAASVWPCYEQVAFDSQQTFTERIDRYLTDPAARATVAQSMRQTVVERFSYASISENLLSLIQRQLSADDSRPRIAA